jgi:hypothetical protein
MKELRGMLILKLVQYGLLARADWRPRLFYPNSKRARQDIRITPRELDEIKDALWRLRHETKYNLEKNQRMYANRVYGGRLFTQ